MERAKRSKASACRSMKRKSPPSSARLVAASPRCCVFSTGCTISIPTSGPRAMSCSTARTFFRPSRISTSCARASAWCSRSRRRFRCRSTRTLRSASGSTKNCRGRSWMVGSRHRCAALWEEVKDKLSANGLSLSGGQQQRLCIARTVAVRPEVILFDEPCSALDPISTAKIEELIDELKDDYTIVIVTHNMQQAARVSDFTAFMYLGELIEFDTTSKMFTAPSDRRSQDYITGRFG